MLRIGKNCARFAAAIAVLLGAGAEAMAEDGAAWRVSKSSGEVWITAEGVQQASLPQEARLKAGDTIRTGRNGRVLLSRGEESMLVSPNSVVGIPVESKEGLSTTILQQAGSILLEVEKRNVKHFEVETPYLAAVVKGTQFRVSVNAAGTSVDVLRGQVEVADFKSGQIAQVLPGQIATAFAQGKSGLALSGTGPFNPIEQGRPRAPSIERIMVPKTGLPAPHNAGDGQKVRSVAPLTHAASAPSSQSSGHAAATHNATRISSSLGEVRLNFHKITNGLARGAEAPNSHAARSTAFKDTIWSSSEAKAGTAMGSSSGQGNSVDSGNSTAAATSIASSAVATSSAATTAAATAVNGNGSGSTGNGQKNNGNGQGNSGNGNNGNGNGNGNGNNGNNGNGHGHGKS